MVDFTVKYLLAVTKITKKACDMSDSVEKDPYKTLTLVLYILYIISIFTGGFIAIVALIINYIKRKDVKNTIFESHFNWQITTFWWYLLWIFLAFVPYIFLIFIGQDSEYFGIASLVVSAICIGILIGSWIWIVYRAIKGIIRLNNNQEIDA